MVRAMRTLELVQPFFTSFEFWDFFGFSSKLCSLVEGALVNKTREQQIQVADERSE